MNELRFWGMGSPVELEASAVELKTIVAKTFALLAIVHTAELDPVTLKKIQLTLIEYKIQIERITNADTIITLDLAEIKEQLEKILNAPLKTLTEHLESRPDYELSHDGGITVKELNLIANLKIAEDAPLKALQAIQQKYAKGNGNLSVKNIFNLRPLPTPQPTLVSSTPAPTSQNNNVVIQLNQTVLSKIIEQELDNIAKKLQEKGSLTMRQGGLLIQNNAADLVEKGSKISFFPDSPLPTTTTTTPDKAPS
jgi:hypothetical protein